MCRCLFVGLSTVDIVYEVDEFGLRIPRSRRRAQEPVLHQERTLAHLPQSDASPQLGEQFGLGSRQRQQLSGRLEFAG